MDDVRAAFFTALSLLIGLDRDLLAIVRSLARRLAREDHAQIVKAESARGAPDTGAAGLK